MKRAIDHIVYCVHDLDKAIEQFERIFGIRPAIGGRHLTKGTKNALLNLGEKCYLEILAIDEANSRFSQARWMGIDIIDGPKITRWALKSQHLEEDSMLLKGHSLDLGQIEEGSRMTADGNELTWRMVLPASTPEVELVPFMTDWSGSASHPTDTLEEGCFLRQINLFHPDGSSKQSILFQLGADVHIQMSDHPHISILVETPNGLKQL
jgi:hypothetical protein